MVLNVKGCTMLTENEKLLLNNIAQNEYTDGQRGPGVWVWCNALTYSPNKIPAASVPGIMASLVKKGLAETDGEVCCLSEAGFAAWKEIHPD